MTILLVFITAFVFNFIWEYFHSRLYVAYKALPITIPILLRAALFDAFFISALYLAFPHSFWVPVTFAFLFAAGLEIFALKTNRWQYKPSMPLIPIINVGLTPIIQLSLLTCIISLIY